MNTDKKRSEGMKTIGVAFPWRSLLGLVICVYLCSSVAHSFSPRYPDRKNLLVWKDAEGKKHPVRTREDWAKRRADILAGMQEVMGPLPADKEKVPLDVKY